MGKEIKKVCRDDDFPLLLLLRDDFLIPVLIRLPIVSLLRFKSVCKYWCTLVETSFFTHLLHTFNSSSSSSSNFGTFILQASVDKYAPPLDHRELHVKKVETEIIILSSESEESKESGSRFRSGPRSGSSGWCWSTDDDDDFQVCKVYGSKDDDDDHVFKVDDDNLVLKLDRLGVPSCYKFSFNWRHDKVMVGSCNGLICLYDKEHMEVTLWNPATRQFRILPKSITTIENGGSTTYLVGFGFDIKTKDYKVVLFSFHCLVQVYSLSTDSWRLLEGIHSSLPGRPKAHGLYLNGSCFFMATYRFPSGPYNRWFLISFNFTREIFTTMEFPDRRHDHTTRGLFLTYFGGDKMALFTIRVPPNYDNYRNCDYSYDDCDIWVWNNEHGCGGMNKESWTKLHSFQMKKRAGEQIRPRGISNNGEFALLESIVGGPGELNKKMKLYNLVTKETKNNFLSCHLVMSRAGVYKPSIVSIKGGNGCQA